MSDTHPSPYRLAWRLAAIAPLLLCGFAVFDCSSRDICEIQRLKCGSSEIVMTRHQRVMRRDILYIERVSKRWWFDSRELLVSATGYDSARIEEVKNALVSMSMTGGPWVLAPLDATVATLRIDLDEDLRNVIPRLRAVETDSLATCAIGVYQYVPEPEQWLVYAKDTRKKFGKTMWLLGAKEVSAELEDSVHLRLVVDWRHRPQRDTVRLQLPTSANWALSAVRLCEETR
jgi:hypothetical protein